MSKWVVMVSMRTSDNFDVYEGEFSGIYHESRDDSREEFFHALHETENDPYIDSVYIKEVFS